MWQLPLRSGLLVLLFLVRPPVAAAQGIPDTYVTLTGGLVGLAGQQGLSVGGGVIGFQGTRPVISSILIEFSALAPRYERRYSPAEPQCRDEIRDVGVSDRLCQISQGTTLSVDVAYAPGGDPLLLGIGAWIPGLRPYVVVGFQTRAERHRDFGYFRVIVGPDLVRMHVGYSWRVPN